LSKSDFSSALKEAPAWGIEDTDVPWASNQIFMAADTDHNGRLDSSEFNFAIEKAQQIASDLDINEDAEPRVRVSDPSQALAESQDDVMISDEAGVSERALRAAVPVETVGGGHRVSKMESDARKNEDIGQNHEEEENEEKEGKEKRSIEAEHEEKDDEKKEGKTKEYVLHYVPAVKDEESSERENKDEEEKDQVQEDEENNNEGKELQRAVLKRLKATAPITKTKESTETKATNQRHHAELMEEKLKSMRNKVHRDLREAAQQKKKLQHAAATKPKPNEQQLEMGVHLRSQFDNLKRMQGMLKDDTDGWAERGGQKKILAAAYAKIKQEYKDELDDEERAKEKDTQEGSASDDEGDDADDEEMPGTSVSLWGLYG